MNDERLERLLGEIRQEQAPLGASEAVRDRVWQKLAGGGSQVCAGFRTEFGDYLAGQLTEGRRLLVDDHLSRCPECRRTMAELRGQVPAKVIVMAPAPSRRRQAWIRWAVAAGVGIAALYAGSDRIDRLLAPSGPRATVETASGDVFRLPQIALQNGASLNDGDVIRTGAGARAVLRLADGSRVELNQRTELFVEAAWSGETIRLNRGDVIVEAAKQRRGHLRVVSSDSTAAVKGTVFAVSTDAVGSVVSVVEGSVAVEQPGTKRLLTAGEKSSTNPSLNRVGVRQSIAWSQDREKYTTLLGEFAGIEKVLTALPEGSVRTEAKLLRNLPAGTLFYFAFPNLNGTLRQAVTQFEQRARENAVLGEWWNSEQGQTLKQTLDRIQAVTPYLGDEVLFLLVNSPNQNHAAFPLLLAQVQPDRQEALKHGLERIAGATEGGVPYRITQDLLLISESKIRLDSVPAVLGTGASSAFAKEIQTHYRTGAGWLAAIDVSALGLHQDASRFLGAGNMRHLFFEQRSSGNGSGDTEATLSFEGVRTGLASWLASPGSTGSTEYVSPEAVAAFSASTRDPRQALEEILSALGQDELAHLRDFESETGVSLTADIAGALGTDFTLAIERPTLPVPGWIAAFEVVRPGVLDDSVRRLVDAFNRHQTVSTPSQVVTLKQETVNGRVWSSLQGPVAALTLYWTYDRGYLVASTDRALAARAISIRDSGSSLTRSAAFQQSVPSSGSLHHSAYIWINTNGALADLAGLIQSPALKSLATSRTPLLIALDGETERIHAASRTRLTSLILDLVLARSTADLPVRSRPPGRPAEAAGRSPADQEVRRTK